MPLMHSPPHPGEILRQDYLAPRGLSVTRAARALGVTRKALSAIVTRRADVDAAMAARLAASTGTSRELWINLQAQYDRWQARRRIVEICSGSDAEMGPRSWSRDQLHER